MATVRYDGPHPELSVTLRIPLDRLVPKADAEWHLSPEQTVLGIAASMSPFKSRNECVALPSGVPRRVPTWAALWLAAARRRVHEGGPWITVRLDRGEWAAVRQQAPWLRHVRQALALTPGVLGLFWAAERRPYSVG